MDAILFEPSVCLFSVCWQRYAQRTKSSEIAQAASPSPLYVRRSRACPYLKTISFGARLSCTEQQNICYTSYTDTHVGIETKIPAAMWCSAAADTCEWVDGFVIGFDDHVYSPDNNQA